jgi:hypothetical protein
MLTKASDWFSSVVLGSLYNPMSVVKCIIKNTVSFFIDIPKLKNRFLVCSLFCIISSSLFIYYLHVRRTRNLVNDVSALGGINAPVNVKSPININNVIGTDKDCRVDVIQPRINQVDQPNLPLANYVRDKKFINKNNNKRMVITSKNITDFSYYRQIVHKTVADFRVMVPNSFNVFLSGLFSFQPFYTSVVYDRSYVHNVTNADLRSDTNSTGFVKHWETKIDEYISSDHYMSCRRPNLIYILKNILPNFASNFVFYIMYECDIDFDIRTNDNILTVSSELIQNLATHKIINPRNDAQTTQNVVDVAISNSSSVNIPRTFVSELNHVFTDSAELIMHLYNEKVFRTSHLQMQPFH